MTIQKAELEFPDYGVVLVTGLNNVAHGKLRSVGAGKTCLGEAISRTLLGVDGRYALLADFSTHRRGNTYVKLDCALNGKSLMVELGYKTEKMSRTGEALRFMYDGGDVIERSHIKLTRNELAQTISLTPEVANWTVYIDGDQLKFNRLSQKESVDLVMASLNQPPWTEYQENVRKVLGNFKIDAETARHSLSEARQRVLDAEEALRQAESDLEAYKAEYGEAKANAQKLAEEYLQKAESKRQEALKLMEGGKKIKAELKRIEEQTAEEHKTLEIQRKTAKSKLSSLRETLKKALEKRTVANTELIAARNRLNKIKATPKVCPTCKQKWPEEPAAEEIDRLSAEVGDTKTRYEELDEVYSDAQDEMTDLENEIEEIEGKQTVLTEGKGTEKLSKEYELAGSKVEELAEQISEYEKKAEQTVPDRSRVISAEAVVKERKQAVAKSKEAVDTAATSLTESESVVSIAEYWNEAFGPTGIPNMILKETIAPLNVLSAKISNKLTGGALSVEYATSRELISGKEKSQLVVNVHNRFGSTKAEGNSKGEGGLTNLIIAETLSEIGSIAKHIGYRWYDETINSQDTTVRRNILKYLHDTAHRLQLLVFVVDHHADIEEFADYVLVAEKGTEGTKYRWV